MSLTKSCVATVLISILLPLSAQASTFLLDGGTDFSFTSDSTSAASAGTVGAGTINDDTSGNGGLNNFFGQASFGGSSNLYGLLGSTNTGRGTNGFNTFGSSTATSITTVSFTQNELNNAASIDIIFSYAWVGNSSARNRDNISVALQPVLGGGNIGIDFFNFSSAPNSNPSYTSSLSYVASLLNPLGNGVTAGTQYKIVLQFAETSDSYNSAFGFDNIVVESVPAPEPSQFVGLLGFGAMGGFALVRRRRSNKLTANS
jgi:MYXO-CTERM domain-containing protein